MPRNTVYEKLLTRVGLSSTKTNLGTSGLRNAPYHSARFEDYKGKLNKEETEADLKLKSQNFCYWKELVLTVVVEKIFIFVYKIRILSSLR